MCVNKGFGIILWSLFELLSQFQHIQYMHQHWKQMYFVKFLCFKVKHHNLVHRLTFTFFIYTTNNWSTLSCFARYCVISASRWISRAVVDDVSSSVLIIWFVNLNLWKPHSVTWACMTKGHLRLEENKT